MSWIEIFSFELALRVDRLLRGQEPESERQRYLDVLIFLTVAGVAYGAVMGTYSGIGPSHARQILYSAVKVPLLLAVSFSLSLPSFYVLNTLLGLKRDFGQTIRAVVGAQAVLTVILAALAPFTGFLYVSGCSYTNAIVLNGVMFAIASGGGQIVLRRSYRTFIERDPRHHWALRAWLVIYIFVAIQMAWVLRPFVGNPLMPTRFLRTDAMSNAYVSVAQIILSAVRGR